MLRFGERPSVGDRVHLPHREAHGVVVEVLGREVSRMFRDGVLEVQEVGRYCVQLACGRRIVVNDRGGQIVRAPAAVRGATPGAQRA